MKILRLARELSCSITSTLAIIGTITAVTGLTEMALIKIGEILKPQQVQIKIAVVVGADIAVLSFAVLTFEMGMEMFEEQAVVEQLAVEQETQTDHQSCIPKTCMGCRNFYGLRHGENLNLLVCAIHPYGPQSACCADWEINSKNLVDLTKAMKGSDS